MRQLSTRISSGLDRISCGLASTKLGLGVGRNWKGFVCFWLVLYQVRIGVGQTWGHFGQGLGQTPPHQRVCPSGALQGLPMLGGPRPVRRIGPVSPTSASMRKRKPEPKHQSHRPHPGPKGPSSGGVLYTALRVSVVPPTWVARNRVHGMAGSIEIAPYWSNSGTEWSTSSQMGRWWAKLGDIFEERVAEQAGQDAPKCSVFKQTWFGVEGLTEPCFGRHAPTELIKSNPHFSKPVQIGRTPNSVCQSARGFRRSCPTMAVEWRSEGGALESRGCGPPHDWRPRAAVRACGPRTRPRSASPSPSHEWAPNPQRRRAIGPEPRDALHATHGMRSRRAASALRGERAP